MDPSQVPPPPPPPANGRDQLVYGAYMPDDTTAGVPDGTVLTEWNSPSVNTVTWSAVTADVEDKIIYGDVKPTFTGNVNQVFRRCKFVGGSHVPTGASGVLDCNSQRTGAGRIVLIDCDIIPRVPARNRDCIVGHRWELYRCRLQKGVDAMGIFKNSANSNADVVAKGCYVSNLTYWYPDYQNGTSGATWHTDGTHNDGAQLQGGKNVTLTGNRWHLTCSYGAGSDPHPTKPWLLESADLESRYAPGSNVIIQNNTGGGIDNTVVIEKNYFTHGGLSQLNVKPGIAFIFRDNYHYRKVAQKSGTWSGYWIRMDDHTSTVTGLLTTNIWQDGPYVSTALQEPRDSGIHYNA